MIEFALAIPFLLLILVAVLFFGRYFFIAQILLYGAQETAKIAARTPNLADDLTRDNLRGFTTTGTALNENSLLYGALSAAHLLSQTTAGSMPPGSVVRILPWDAGAGDTLPPAGTVSVRVDYPFQLTGNPFQGPTSSPIPFVAVATTVTGPPQSIQFLNFTISQTAVAAQEVYQQ
jgi:hypothetical protein